MRKPSKIELTDEQRSTLMIWVVPAKPNSDLAKRAQVILCAAAGMSLKDIEAKVGLGFQSCLKWRKRFVESGLKGLRDIPRKGRPAVITPEERVHVMSLACTKPDDYSNQWTTTKLADASGLSRTTVHRILNEATLKPHKIDHWCGKSPDPEFEPKQTDILGLYLSPPENALVISVDESHKSRHWTELSRCCPCDQTRQSGKPILTPGMAQPDLSPQKLDRKLSTLL